METYHLKNEVHVFCVTAKSFPNGIIEAFKALGSLDPSIYERPFYGISQMQQGKVCYKAAVAEVYVGEGSSYGCETWVIPQGWYLTEVLFNYMESTEIITDTFQKLVSDARMDQDFPCIEWYKNEHEVMCMIKIRE